MMQTINPYATARTAEIMSRYRPIAPKPADSSTTSTITSGETDQNSAMPQNISKSPYLRNVWANLQARPTRTRKRGRSAAFGPPASLVKRSRACLQGLSPSYQQVSSSSSPAKNLAMHGFVHANSGVLPQISLVPIKCGGGLDSAVSTLAETVASLPLFRCATTVHKPCIDLNTAVADQDQQLPNQGVMPRELDFMAQLKEPVKPTVISPRAVRPIGSKIIVSGVIEDSVYMVPVWKGSEGVEKEVEAENVPVIVSDSRNRVRLANSAYKEMVGQPECCWLDSVGVADCGGVCRRISGEVVIKFTDSEAKMPVCGFNCGVKIEWEKDGKKSSVDASCEGVKVECEGKDYQFLWRFHIIN